MTSQLRRQCGNCRTGTTSWSNEHDVTAYWDYQPGRELGTTSPYDVAPPLLIDADPNSSLLGINKSLKGKWAALACHETGSLIVVRDLSSRTGSSTSCWDMLARYSAKSRRASAAPSSTSSNTETTLLTTASGIMQLILVSRPQFHPKLDCTISVSDTTTRLILWYIPSVRASTRAKRSLRSPV
ncbi:hypothetical protein B0H13DRAFT_2352287 [Mycena leptocephala]|nr:hypothetical protein B0H13DRAFT_2352287 [Mycena leptocephala]